MAGSEQSGAGNPLGKIFFEFTQVGQQMRVAAIDEATGTEVVVVAPLTATQLQMQTVAEAKLRRKLALDDASTPPRASGPGKLA